MMGINGDVCLEHNLMVHARNSDLVINANEAGVHIGIWCEKSGINFGTLVIPATLFPDKPNIRFIKHKTGGDKKEAKISDNISVEVTAFAASRGAGWGCSLLEWLYCYAANSNNAVAERKRAASFLEPYTKYLAEKVLKDIGDTE